MRKVKLYLLILIILILTATSGFIFINNTFNSKSPLFINVDKDISKIYTSIKSIIRYTDDFNGANDTNALKARGYLTYYRGTGPQGTSAAWFQGKPSYFPAFNGPQNGYVAADFNTATGQNNIDNWLVLPKIQGGILLNDIMYFYSRAEQNSPYVDSIRVMYSLVDSIPEGSWQEIGRFKVNTMGFWEQRGFQSTAPGINGRFAIRYCISNGGPGGQNSNYIGIDAISILSDTSKPVITHTKLADFPKINWPPQVKCTVTGNNGIDSVWISWKRNSGIFQRFNMSNGGGNNWSGFFNSDTSQIDVGDSIFYRIIARSASIQHPIDSTELLKFNIFFAIGAGIVPSNFPYNGLYRDERMDMLYLSSEIAASKIFHGFITKIGFNVITLYSNLTPFTSFRIKMQAINDTSIYSFHNSGWTICLDSSYLPVSTGWQFVPLTTPFYWNAGDNLLIEICFDLPQAIQPYPVYATTLNDKVYGCFGYYPFLYGCMATAGLSFTYRPNIALIIDPDYVSNSGNINYQLPDKFKLFQNYPNPFNPNTKIDYAIPKNGFVSLKIYDVLGKELKTLVNEIKNPGYYSVDFNTSDFSSGVYFYKLESNGCKDVKRMLLIK